MKTFFKFAVARLSEASTYRGIVLALTGLGVYVSPEAAAAVTSLGLGITGLIGIFFADPVTAPAE
jgi:hypothetical protein